MNPDESLSFNSWLFASCIFFAAGSCYLGSVGQWHQVGPATVAALFLIMCAPYIAMGKTATPDAESEGWRALALMTAIAGGLIFSELSFTGPLFRTALHVPEPVGDGAAGWFMIAAMLGMGAFVILLAVFCLVILWVVLTRAVDITGVLASATLPLLAVLAALPLLLNI